MEKARVSTNVVVRDMDVPSVGVGKAVGNCCGRAQFVQRVPIGH